MHVLVVMLEIGDAERIETVELEEFVEAFKLSFPSRTVSRGESEVSQIGELSLPKESRYP